MVRTRAPKVDHQRLKEFLASRDKVDELWERFQQFEDLRRKGELTTPFIAMEALVALLGGRKAGFSDVDLRRSWPDDWGDQTVEVPAALLQALAFAWLDYCREPAGKALDRTFGLGARRQGEHPTVKKLKTIDKDRRLANEVSIDYVTAAAEGTPKPLDAIFHDVANRCGSNYQRVRKAYRDYGKYAQEQLMKAGILKG